MKITEIVGHIPQCMVDQPLVSARSWLYGMLPVGRRTGTE